MAATIERDLGVAVGAVVVGRGEPIEPAGVDGALDHLGTVDEVEQERLVGGAALDQDRRLRQGSAQADPRRVAVSPQAMTLAIIESYSGAITSPSATPVSTRMPGPVGRSRVSMRPGAGANPASGSSALSRASNAWPASGGALALEPSAHGDVELELDEVDARQSPR